MRRSVLVLTVLIAPGMLAAQSRPSNTMHTNSAELYFQRAKQTNREQEKQELLQKALEFARQAIAARADNPKGYLVAGQILVLQGNALAADSMFDRAEQLWPDYKKETERDRMQVWVRSFNAGVVAMRDQKPAEALAHFEAANLVYPGRPTPLLNMAQIYMRQNQPAKAAEAYRAALDILKGPDRKTLKADEEKQWADFELAATFNLAQLLAAQDKNDEALALYRDFLSRNPDNALAMSNLATVLSKTGKAEEATRVYQQLLARDLTDAEFFNVGVGLFRASQYSQAAEAFRRALAKNPHMRDAYFNMAQALYALARDLAEERDKVKTNPAQVKALDARLTPVLTELGELAEKLRAIDPGSRSVAMMRAYAYRALGDITTGAIQTEWKNKTLAALQANEALTFDVQDITMTAAGDEIQIAGSLVNFKGKAGEPVRLRFHFLDKNGATIGTPQEVTVSMPEVQGASAFKVSIKTRDEVAGWKYEIAK